MYLHMYVWYFLLIALSKLIIRHSSLRTYFYCNSGNFPYGYHSLSRQYHAILILETDFNLRSIQNQSQLSVIPRPGDKASPSYTKNTERRPPLGALEYCTWLNLILLYYIVLNSCQIDLKILISTCSLVCFNKNMSMQPLNLINDIHSRLTIFNSPSFGTLKLVVVSPVER